MEVVAERRGGGAFQNSYRGSGWGLRDKSKRDSSTAQRGSFGRSERGRKDRAATLGM